jgi:hypothetical protein
MSQTSAQSHIPSNLFECFTVSALTHRGIEIGDLREFSKTPTPPKIEDGVICDYTRMQNCRLVDHWQPANEGQILVCWKVGIPSDEEKRGILFHGGNIICRYVTRNPYHQEGLTSLLIIAKPGDDITIYQGKDDQAFNRHVATLSILTPSSLQGTVQGLRFKTSQTTDLVG